MRNLLIRLLFAWVCFCLTQSALHAEQTPQASGVKELSSLLEWSVVYQRRDGIYQTATNLPKPRLLVSAGRYPRWSPDGQSVAFIKENSIALF
ncbi:MAG TPA: hypothetical protein PLP17_07235, partial [Oligoflexia bacterium]|nr:hypothetical protein [Oligoflexia bacterium]